MGLTLAPQHSSSDEVADDLEGSLGLIGDHDKGDGRRVVAKLVRDA